MATSLQSDMKIYDPRMQGGYREMLDQKVDMFNAASAGGIRLIAGSKPGDFEYEAFFKDVSGLVQRRDNTSIAAATATKSIQGEMVDVKCNRMVLHEVTRNALIKTGADFGSDGAQWALGEAIAMKTAQDRLNTGIIALSAALRNVAGAGYDGKAVGTLTPTMLSKALRTRGDRGDVVAWLMNSAASYDLIDQQLASTTSGIGDITLYQGTAGSLGKPMLVTDSPALAATVATIPCNVIIGLTADALVIEDTEEEFFVGEIVTGLQQLIYRTQGEYAFNVGVKGFAFDVANGGSNPTDATVGTGTNWDQVVTSVKDVAGCWILAAQEA